MGRGLSAKSPTKTVSSQSGSYNPSNNERYTSGSQAECELPAPGTPNGNPGKDRDRCANREQRESAESDACDNRDTSRGDQKWENRNYGAQREKHEGCQSGLKCGAPQLVWIDTQFLACEGI